MITYSIPIPELRTLEPILAECFGYRRAMFLNELQAAYHLHYPNGAGEEIVSKYRMPFPYLDESRWITVLLTITAMPPDQPQQVHCLMLPVSSWIQSTKYS